MMKQIEYIVGNEDILTNIDEIESWNPFDERIIELCSELSDAILINTAANNFPDLISLAFWLRKSNINKQRNNYLDRIDCLGLGLIFHIAPGNMALSFAYSLVTGLLSGNTNIIRMPSRVFEQDYIFCSILKRCILDKKEIQERICLIKYPHNKDITDELSQRCNMRVIWGGNDTINTIRLSPLPPRAREITFANRFSICLINSDYYLDECNVKRVAHNFYIDTFLSDQNACSSPKIVFWIGSKIEAAKKIFWESLESEIKNYNLAPISIVDKMLTMCKFSANNKSLLSTNSGFKIMRLQIDTLNRAILDNLCSTGFFYEYNIDDISDIKEIMKWELQTISYLGFDSKLLKKKILDVKPKGVDRIVPVGKTMDFSLIWDGHDIIREMTREIFTL